MLLLYIYTISYLHVVVARPSAEHATVTSTNVTTPGHTPYMIPDPDTRGTYTLISSCFSTLFICVWTAVHLNVPAPYHGKFRRLSIRLMYMTAGVLLPEYLLWMAFRQRIHARGLLRAVNRAGSVTACTWQAQHTDSFGLVEDPCGSYFDHELSSSMKDVPNLKRRKKHQFQPWNMTTAFFGVMGGFAVDTSSFSDYRTVTLSPVGMLQLALAGCLPDISQSQIEQMSKQDIIKNFLTVLQVSWFCAQCISRPIRHLPMSLLELHVIAQAFCALTMYLIWWEKPYDVGNPILCTDERIMNLTALFLLEGQVHHDPEHGSTRQTVWFHPENTDLIDAQPSKQKEYFWRAQRAVRYLRAHESRHIDWLEGDGRPDFTSMAPKEYVLDYASNHKPKGRLLSKTKASEAAALKDIKNRQLQVYGSIAMSTLYGSCYFGAWNFTFPTSTELWLWRGSAISLIAGPIALALMHFVELGFEANGLNEQRGFRSLGKFVPKTQRPFLLLCMLACLAFPYARMYVLVECFVALRSPPAGTYELVNWSNVIPHVS